jgi:hypothetical protein
MGEIMKKTAAAIILLAGLGGGCVSPNASNSTTGGKVFNTAYRAKDVKGVTGGAGEPIQQVGAKVPDKMDGIVQAGGIVDPNVTQAAGFSRILGSHNTGCNDCGDTGGKHRLLGNWGGHGGGCNTGNCYGGGGYGGGGGMPGIPGGGPWANMGMTPYGPMSGMNGPMYPNQRTAVKFLAPQGMNVTWWANGAYAEPGLSTPSAYNFAQGNIYRLRVRGIANRPGKVYYPTIEVYGATPKTITFLSHNTVPVGFTDEDFEQVNAGNLVVKVIYLPDPAYQELSTVAGAEELVSTKLQPGENPIAEAERRGTILAVIRVGNIDLENPNSPAMTSGPMGAMPQMGMPMSPVAGVPSQMPAATVTIPAVKPTTPKTAAPVSTTLK